MSTITGAEMVVRTLEELGVQTIFGIPGVHNLDIYENLLDSSIEHVTARHEEGAGFMADGLARQTGKPGVCLVITGPGLTNVSTAVAQAYSDSIPMLVISSQVPESWRGKNRGYLHELENSTHFASSFVKESRRVPRKEFIELYVKEAYQLANTGRKGPVHLEFPLDILKATLSEKHMGRVTFHIEEEAWTLCDQKEKLEKAAKTLHAEKNKVIIAGRGAAGMGETLVDLAEKMSAPILTTVAGKGVVPEDHPLCLGARIPLPPAQKLLREAGAILAVGTKLSHIDFRKDLDFIHKLIYVDIDQGNMLEGMDPELFIQGDAEMAGKELITQWQYFKTGTEKMDSEALNRWCQDFKIECQEMLEAFTGFEKEELKLSLDLIDAIREALPRDGLLISDMATPGYLAVRQYPAYQPNTFIFPVTFGTLGYALPSAIGAVNANSKKDIVVLTGDGGMQFTMQELGVIAQLKLPITVLLWNNHGYGEIKRKQEARHPGQTIAVQQDCPDFAQIAAAYDFTYEKIFQGEDIGQKIKSSIAHDGPVMIEIIP